VPHNLADGERRPLIVCQHGLEGTPRDTISREPRPFASYKAFSEELVKRGFIVYAPQNPYRGGDRFRVLQRMSNPLGRSLFSYIIAQHEQTLDWLATLQWVDARRIAFYGLSYGGKTAMRVPPLVERYALAICSGDFTDWPRTIASNDETFSYLFTSEYEIPEWNLAHVANYAELAMLVSPRPFMVEAGHRDSGQPRPSGSPLNSARYAVTTISLASATARKSNSSTAPTRSMARGRSASCTGIFNGPSDAVAFHGHGRPRFVAALHHFLHRRRREPIYSSSPSCGSTSRTLASTALNLSLLPVWARCSKYSIVAKDASFSATAVAMNWFISKRPASTNDNSRNDEPRRERNAATRTLVSSTICGPAMLVSYMPLPARSICQPRAPHQLSQTVAGEYHAEQQGAGEHDCSAAR
jgi:hypothetical protein